MFGGPRKLWDRVNTEFRWGSDGYADRNVVVHLQMMIVTYYLCLESGDSPFRIHREDYIVGLVIITVMLL